MHWNILVLLWTRQFWLAGKDLLTADPSGNWMFFFEDLPGAMVVRNEYQKD